MSHHPIHWILTFLTAAAGASCRRDPTAAPGPEAVAEAPIFGGITTFGSCGSVVPDISASPLYDSPWNPLADGIQNNTETAIDLGGTWTVPAPQVPTPLLTALNLTPSCRLNKGFSDGACTANGNISGRLLELTLNGIDYRCFFPAAPVITEKVVVLNIRATIGDGDMHENNDKYSFPVSDHFYGSCGYRPPHGGHPIHLAARGIVALGIYLRSNHPQDVEKFVLSGESFGSFIAPVAALIGQGHPQFPIAGVLGIGGHGVQENPPFFDGIEYLLAVNHAGGYGRIGEDAEVVRTFEKSLGINSLADVDLTNWASSWSLPFWLFLGQEDPTSWADYQTEKLTQLFPSGQLVHVFHSELGSHKGDGIVVKKLGVHDPWAGQSTILDPIEALEVFIRREVLHQALPAALPVTIGTPHATPTDVDFLAALSPDLAAGPSGPMPQLLAIDKRLGLGALVGALDSLIVHVDEDQKTRLTFGGISGVVRQVVVENGAVEEKWRRVVGYGVSGLIDLGDDMLLSVTKDGRIARLRRSNGDILQISAPFYLGHEPRNGKLGTAYSLVGGAPVEHRLAFYSNEEGELIGVDPADLSIRFKNDRLGYFEDWDFTAGGVLKTAWLGMYRGHLINVALQLPDCVHVLAMTEYLGTAPHKVVALGQNVLAVDQREQHLFLSDGAKVSLPLLAGTNHAALIGTGNDSASLELVRFIPGTTLMVWAQKSGRIGLSDLAAVGPGLAAPIPPIATGAIDRRIMALGAVGQRAFGTTDNGAVFEMKLAAAQSKLNAPLLNLPLSARGVARDPATGRFKQFTHIPDARKLSLLDINFDAPQPVSVAASQYSDGDAALLSVQSQLVWSGGAGYLTYEGALASFNGVPRVFTPRSFDFDLGNGLVDLTGGHLTSYPVTAAGGASNPPLFVPKLSGPAVITYEKYTNNMGGAFNENGSGLMILDADGHYTGYFSTAGGYVFKQRFHGVTAAALGPAQRSKSFGWKGGHMIMGKHRTADGVLVDALYVGLWLLAGRVAGGVVIVDPVTLQEIGEIESGQVSFGLLQADLTGDGKLELVVGSATRLTVYDENYQVLHRSTEEAAAFGSFGRLWFDGEHLVAGTVDGLVRYRVNAP